MGFGDDMMWMGAVSSARSEAEDARADADRILREANANMARARQTIDGLRAENQQLKMMYTKATRDALAMMHLFRSRTYARNEIMEEMRSRIEKYNPDDLFASKENMHAFKCQLELEKSRDPVIIGYTYADGVVPPDAIHVGDDDYLEPHPNNMF